MHALTLPLAIPALLQAIAMAVDEGWYHRRRGLPRWERLGHPVDTATVALCYGWLLLAEPTSPHGLPVYIGLSILSCLVITKDEPIHARACTAGEMWLHAVLFVLHPIVLGGVGLIWWLGDDRWVIAVQLGLTAALLVHQLVYWSLLWKPAPPPRTAR
jgi:hypothetical protein